MNGHQLLDLTGRVAVVTGGTRGLGLAMAVAYSTSKGGLLSLTRALAGQWGVHGITVNAICPGFIPSQLSRGILDKVGGDVIAATPLRQLGTDDDMKVIVVLLAGAGGWHITGQYFAVDGGITAV